MSQGDAIDQIYDHLFVERINGLTRAERSTLCDLERRLLERHGSSENLFIAINNMELGRAEFGDEYREFDRLREKMWRAEYDMEVKGRDSGSGISKEPQGPLFDDEHRQAGMHDPVENASSRCGHDDVEWLHGDHRPCSDQFKFGLCQIVVCASCRGIVPWDALAEAQHRHLYRTA